MKPHHKETTNVNFPPRGNNIRSFSDILINNICNNILNYKYDYEFIILYQISKNIYILTSIINHKIRVKSSSSLLKIYPKN
jgi:hypothetical protein